MRRFFPIIMILSFSIVASPAEPYAQELQSHDASNTIMAETYYEYSSNTKRFAFNFGMLAKIPAANLEYGNSIGILQFVKADGETIYSLGLPVTLGLLGMARLANKVFLTQDSKDTTQSHRHRITAFHYLLMFPNSTYRYRLTNIIRPTLSMNTDYLLYKSGKSSRGLLFTPSIGVTLFGNWGTAGGRGINVYVGRSMFWSFDNERRGSAITFGINAFVSPLD